jgi:hypothetical protein
VTLIYIPKYPRGIQNPIGPDLWEFDITIGVYEDAGASPPLEIGYRNFTSFGAPPIGAVSPDSNIDGYTLRMVSYASNLDETSRRLRLEVSGNHASNDLQFIEIFNDTTSQDFQELNVDNFQTGGGVTFWSWPTIGTNKIWEKADQNVTYKIQIQLNTGGFS